MSAAAAAGARLVFAGTPAFAVPSLEALAGSAHQLVAVYTQPDRPAGRGRRIQRGPVAAAADRLGIEVRQPRSLRKTDAIAALAQLQPDLVVVAAYGLLLPPEVLAIPRLGCVNVHASLLPRWRGAAPVQYAILAGDRQTGITLMQMDAGLDTGDMLAHCTTPIGAGESGGELTARLARLGGELLACELEALLAGALTPVPQPADQVTLAPKITKQQAEIDWHDDARQIARAVRAYDPWPVAQTTYHGRQLRIWRASAVDASAAGAAGTVVAVERDALVVATGAGALRITELQPSGKRRMTVRDFVNANDPAGVVLGCG